VSELPHIGDFVRVKMIGGGLSKQKAEVIGYDPKIAGSVKLAGKLERFQWWNKDSLELVK
jgi:hypothetical protein